MIPQSFAPHIEVTIGFHTRSYFAFVTTAPATLDGPATVTLHAATFTEVACFVAEMVTFDRTLGQSLGRLILVDATELDWQRAQCRRHCHRLLPADPGLVGRRTLQEWLWRRIQSHTHSNS
jgi:hypothetical protein